jgi:hypothetical protein
MRSVKRPNLDLGQRVPVTPVILAGPAFAMRGRGRGRGRGHGRSIVCGRTSENRSGAYGESAGNTSGGPSEYGTRKGACHTSGHYSFECKASENGNNAKAGANTAHSDSSGRSKGK